VLVDFNFKITDSCKTAGKIVISAKNKIKDFLTRMTICFMDNFLRMEVNL